MMYLLACVSNLIVLVSAQTKGENQGFIYYFTSAFLSAWFVCLSIGMKKERKILISALVGLLF